MAGNEWEQKELQDKEERQEIQEKQKIQESPEVQENQEVKENQQFQNKEDVQEGQEVQKNQGVQESQISGGSKEQQKTNGFETDRTRKHRVLDLVKRHPVIMSWLASVLLGILMFAGFLGSGGYGWNALFAALFWGGILGNFLLYPFVLTAANLAALTQYRKEGRRKKIWKSFEYTTIVLGILYSLLLMSYNGTVYTADWYVVLSNSEIHTPLETGSAATVVTLALVGLAGYLLITLVPLKKMPPLVTVCGISAMYIGIGVCAVWIVQLFKPGGRLLCLLPFNCTVIGVKTVLTLVWEWKQLQQERAEEGNGKEYKNSLLRRLNSYLEQSERWPLAAFFLMWPLLGIVVCVLVLFGQQPDAVIRAWTETSDWNLSRRVAPQNVYYDEHYLCTVAAGGHENVVKPLRLGVRHGHEVIVNRQLCVANAFEQLLEERMPRIHRHIRHFYDTYGFPIAQKIRSPFAADAIYILMKPLEWMFLATLYFCDVNPENRIAVQYLPKRNMKGV